jgi:hypothetical protein
MPSRDYQAGETYTFEVYDLKEINDKKYFLLTDGEIHTYRVMAFDFQTEWEPSNTRKFMECYVRSTKIYGLPFLEQLKYKILTSIYTELDSSYSFRIVEIETDKNTNAQFYKLRDAQGLIHRYYPKTIDYKVNDTLNLNVKGIENKENNKSHLLLEAIETDKKSTSTEKSNINDEAVSELHLGVENDTTEFKTSIVFPAGGITADIDRQLVIINKVIAGFLNKNGGDLYLGVGDDGFVAGIEEDLPYLNMSETDPYRYGENFDHYELKIRNSIKYYLGTFANNKTTISFHQDSGMTYCHLKIEVSPHPIYHSETKLYQRVGNMTQLLKGDVITYFIEEKLRAKYNLGNQKEDFAKTNSFEEDFEEMQPLNSEVNRTQEEILHLTKEEIKVWRYLNFFKDGSWNYTKNENKEDNIIKSISIPEHLKHERLIIAYKNGKVNQVVPYDIIRPKGKNGKRKTRNEGEVYKTGWNTDSNILNAFCVNSKDLLVFISKDYSDNQFVKIHYPDDIEVYNQLNIQGNKIVNESLDLQIVKVQPLPIDYRRFVSALLVRKNQRTSTAGIRWNDRSYQKSIKTLEGLLEIDR